jgi:hypothetical protein
MAGGIREEREARRGARPRAGSGGQALSDARPAPCGPAAPLSRARDTDRAQRDRRRTLDILQSTPSIAVRESIDVAMDRISMRHRIRVIRRPTASTCDRSMRSEAPEKVIFVLFHRTEAFSAMACFLLPTPAYLYPCPKGEP